MLNVADLARFTGDSSSQSADEGQVANDGSAAAIEEDDFSNRPTAERPAFEEPLAETVAIRTEQPKQPSYLIILIIALISLLLLGATGFFVYSVYLKQKPPPAEQQPE